MSTHQGLAVLFVLFSPIAALAEEYLLQLDVVEADENTVSRSFETVVNSDRPFYVRSVDGDFQTVLQGTVWKRPMGKFLLEFTYEETELCDGPYTLTQFSSSHILDRNVRGFIKRQAKESNSRTKYGFTVRDFTPVIGFRDTSSSITVQLVDLEGRPVKNANASFYGRQGDDWVCIIGPVVSDAEGVVRVTEGRESLPSLTFFAEQTERGIVGVANLNRTLAVQPYTITMTRKLQSWKRPWQVDDR